MTIFSFSHSRSSEKGSALFFVLIAVMLFAALSYTVMNMMRSGDPSMIGEERMNLLAGEVLDYARSVRSAVQDMRISNGCSDSDISFENPFDSSYDTGGNTRCHVFHSSGGGLSWVSPSDDIGSEWLIQGDTHVGGLGGSDSELILFLPGLADNMCETINEKLGISGIPEDDDDFTDGAWGTVFTGAYGSEDVLNGDDTCPDGNLCGVSAACFKEGSGDAFNIFYQVLIAR